MCYTVGSYCLSFYIVVVQLMSHVRLFSTSWTVACQAPLFKGFPRQEYWSGSPCPPLGELSNPGIEPKPPALQADSLSSEPPGKPCLMYKCDQHFRKQLFNTGRIRKPGYYNLDRGDGDDRG